MVLTISNPSFLCPRDLKKQPSENGIIEPKDYIYIFFFFGGDLTPLSLSENMTGCLGMVKRANHSGTRRRRISVHYGVFEVAKFSALNALCCIKASTGKQL